MKIRYLMLLLFALGVSLTVNSQETSAQETPSPDDLLTEIYISGDFRIKYPQGWTVDDDQLSNQIVFSNETNTSLRPDQSLEAGRMLVAIALPASLSEIQLEPDADPQTVINTFTTFLETITASISRDEVVIGDFEGIRADIVTTEGVHIMVAALKHNLNTVTVLAMTPEDEFDSQEALALAMLATIEFNPDLLLTPFPTGTPLSQPVTPESARPMPPPLTQTYIGGGISVDYPVGWIILNEDEGLEVEFGTDEEQRVGQSSNFTRGEYAIAFVLPPILLDIGLTVNATPDEVVEMLSVGFLDVVPRNLETQSFTVQGYPAVVASVEGKVAMSVAFDEGTIAVGGQTAPGGEDLLEILMSQILDTFSFTPDAEPDTTSAPDQDVRPPGESNRRLKLPSERNNED